MRQINFNNYRDDMTEADKLEIFNLLTRRCRAQTKDLIWRRLTLHLGMIPYYGIFERIIKGPYGWTYCAGQDYPSEISLVRKLIKECK